MKNKEAQQIQIHSLPGRDGSNLILFLRLGLGLHKPQNLTQTS